jgi:hypothetical protein
MLRWTKVNPNERLLLESPVNRYKVAGPGRVWLSPRQRILARVYVGPNAPTFRFENVRTAEEVAVDIQVKVIYKADPELFSHDLLSRIPLLNEGGWQGAVNWHAEYVLRMLAAHQPWRELDKEQVKIRLERQFTQTLADRLKMMGLNVLAVYLIKVELPVNLQKTLVQAERDFIEAQGRIEVLRQYFEIFGSDLARVLPYILQWEMMNLLHKKGDPKMLLASESIVPKLSWPINDTPPVYQLQLPVGR